MTLSGSHLLPRSWSVMRTPLWWCPMSKHRRCMFFKGMSFERSKGIGGACLKPYFASFAAKNGNVNRAGTDGVQAYRYILSLGPEEFRPPDWRPANPSYLLPVLLLFGAKLRLGNIWNLLAIDRVHGGFFIPSSYRDFGRKMIDQGINYTQQIGFGIWSWEISKTV